MIKVRQLKKNQLVKIIRKFEIAVKKDCQDCMGGQKRVDCEIETCSLYPFRPWAKRILKNDSGKDNKISSLVKNNK